MCEFVFLLFFFYFILKKYSKKKKKFVFYFLMNKLSKSVYLPVWDDSKSFNPEKQH